MKQRISRREFLAGAAAMGASLPVRAQGANDRIVVGVMGMGGRGTELARVFQQRPNVEVAWVCDADSRRVAAAVEVVEKAGAAQKPRTTADFRRILDDRSVDALVIAACNHWHAPATILACSAGKHVYVEKPCSHNPWEGETMVAAARKHNRRVQMGNQRRSWPAVMEAIERVRSGEIGPAYFAQARYANSRPSIGRAQVSTPPSTLDYDLWQGPAPRRPFRENYLHYNWHWFWHWGNGEMGNNGVHMIDVCRWGLGVDLPERVSSLGGRYRYQDDQETPDTNVATFTFPCGRMIAWEGLSCSRMPKDGTPDALFHGEKGSLAIYGGGYAIYDSAGKEIHKAAGPGGDVSHVENFLNAIRSAQPLHSEIAEGHRSTLLTHLANISYRVGRTLHCDPESGRIKGDREADRLWKRAYEPGWEPRL